MSLLSWPFLLPFVLIIFEIAAAHFYPFSSPYFSLLVMKQPLLLILYTVLSLLRVYAAYCFFSLIVELCTKRWIRSSFSRGLIFLSLYLTSTHFAFIKFPSLQNLFSHTSKKMIFLAVLFFISTLWFLSKKNPQLKSRTYLLVIFFLLVFLKSTSHVPWEVDYSQKHPPNKTLPSFFVLSFDAVPNDLFHYSEGEKYVAPLWKKNWKSKSTNFTNAYTVTNSTYTSWFSTLTGVMPLDSEVSSLYPSNRTGNVSDETWLPKKLQSIGYETAFLTDCANTSFMKKEFGFNRLYQQDKGAFNSTNSLVTSAHPGLYAFSQLFSTAYFFPELVSFSSHQYESDLFFTEVEKTLNLLQQENRPYFLVVHSCITHRDMIHHLPEQNSPLRTDLPNFHNYHSKNLEELFYSLRMADVETDKLFRMFDNEKKKPWRILVSDHGIRMDPKGTELSLFSHAIGDAISRFQYNVPLSIISPTEMILAQDTNSLVTIQDMGSFIHNVINLKTPILYPERDSLLLTSAVPSETPENWGKTLVPLVSNGILDKEGTFSFSEDDDYNLTKRRSRALLRLPYRIVWGSDGEWNIYNEVLDPFNKSPLTPHQQQRILSQVFAKRKDNQHSFLKVN